MYIVFYIFYCLDLKIPIYVDEFCKPFCHQILRYIFEIILPFFYSSSYIALAVNKSDKIRNLKNPAKTIQNNKPT